MNISRYYFPILPSHCHYSQSEKSEKDIRQRTKNIKYDINSIAYMSKRVDAEFISGIIILHLEHLGKKYSELTITDATAGIGGNTLSFAALFKHVNSVELDVKVCEMLINNIKCYNYTNLSVFNNDYVAVMEQLKQSVVFIDPPWGGRNYKKLVSVALKLSGENIEDLCYRLSLKGNIVAIKLPLNYNFGKFVNMMRCNSLKLYIHKLEKMYIVISYSEKMINVAY